MNTASARGDERDHKNDSDHEDNHGNNNNNDNNCNIDDNNGDNNDINNHNNNNNDYNYDNNNYNNNNNNNYTLCKISCVPNGVQRFCIRGLGSLALLEKVLKTNKNNRQKSKKVDANEVEVGVEFESNKNNDINKNEDFFEKVFSYQPISRIWPENGILGISVRDVRKLTNHFKTQNLNEIDNDKDVSTKNKIKNEMIYDGDKNENISDSRNKKLKWPINSSSSLLWNGKERRDNSNLFVSDHILNNKLFESKQNEYQVLNDKNNDNFFVNDFKNPLNSSLKSSNIINKTNENENKNNHHNISVLIIRKDLKNNSSKRLKNKKNKSFLGFDIIFPAKWGSAVWRAFQYAGGKAIGISELDSINNDYGIASFPR